MGRHPQLEASRPARTGPVVSEQGLRNTRWMAFVPTFSTEDGEVGSDSEPSCR